MLIHFHPINTGTIHNTTNTTTMNIVKGHKLRHQSEPLVHIKQACRTTTLRVMNW